MLTKNIIVVPWQPQWSRSFEKIRDTLLPELNGFILTIEHVGSTSVPGLAAKPIIDIDIVIEDQQAFPAVKEALTRLRYQHVGDLGIPGREAFKYSNKPELMEHHLYVCSRDSSELARHLALREHLKTHPQDRDRYAQIKYAAAARHPTDIDAYLEEKTPIILEIYQKCGLNPTL